jgi:hypothetical protein
MARAPDNVLKLASKRGFGKCINAVRLPVGGTAYIFEDEYDKPALIFDSQDGPVVSDENILLEAARYYEDMMREVEKAYRLFRDPAEESEFERAIREFERDVTNVVKRFLTLGEVAGITVYEPPAPWAVQIDFKADEMFVIDSDGYPICRVLEHDRYSFDPDYRYELAKLLCAVPQMLYLLSKLYRRMTEVDTTVVENALRRIEWSREK